MALATSAVIFLIIISLFGKSMAAVYNVGDAAGWTSTGVVDYGEWADHKNFHVGDTLVFEYSNEFHNVKQVSQSDFLSCDSTTPIATYVTGSDSITLRSAGRYYFLCGIPGHCEAGQKVEILVTPTSLSPTAGPVLAPSPTAGESETSTTTYSSTDKNTAPSLYSSNFWLALVSLHAIFVVKFFYI